MDNNTKKREEAISRFMASKARKQQRINHLVDVMKKEYEQRTGLSADYIFVL